MLYQSADGTFWRTEYRSCPVCKSDSFKTIGNRGGDCHHARKGVRTTIVRCIECEILYTRPTMVPESNPYDKDSPDQYFQLHVSEEKILAGEHLAAQAESILGRTGRLLEIGCGRGENLIGARNCGWNVSGIEMTRAFANIAQKAGIEVDNNTADSSRFLNRKYDVILLAAVLEHLYDPAETIEKIFNALVEGGLLFIDVPNEGSLAMRTGNLYMKLRGRSWAVNLSPTFPPYHVVGFTPKSLTHLLQNKGFNIIDLKTVKWSNDLPRKASLIYMVERSLFGMIQSAGALVGMGDGIICWALKRNTGN